MTSSRLRTEAMVFTYRGAVERARNAILRGSERGCSVIQE
jgi:hypothetical protein